MGWAKCFYPHGKEPGETEAEGTQLFSVTSEIAEALRNLLEQEDLPGGSYQSVILKARKEIEDWATAVGETLPTSDRNDLGTTKDLQDLGDKMRAASNLAWSPKICASGWKRTRVPRRL